MSMLSYVDVAVRVKFILTAADDGSDAASMSTAQADAHLAETNVVYAKAGITFVLDGIIGPLNSTKLAQDPPGPGNEVDREAKALEFPIHLVVFVREAPFDAKGDLYSSSGSQHVVMKSIQAGAHKLAHEVGHFFDLAHTHPEDDVTGVNAVFATKPPSARVGCLEAKLSALGLTSQQAADRFDADRAVIHDTPPDPGPPLFQPNDDSLECCSGPDSVTLNWRLSDGSKQQLVLKPDKTNVMSYFHHCPGPKQLSDGQAAHVRASLNGIRNRLLPIPVATDTSTPPPANPVIPPATENVPPATPVTPPPARRRGPSGR